MSFIKTFDQVIKHNFDQTPVLLENFDQVIRSSAIRSSDPFTIRTRMAGRVCTTPLRRV